MTPSLARKCGNSKHPRLSHQFVWLLQRVFGVVANQSTPILRLDDVAKPQSLANLARTLENCNAATICCQTADTPSETSADKKPIAPCLLCCRPTAVIPPQARPLSQNGGRIGRQCPTPPRHADLFRHCLRRKVHPTQAEDAACTSRLPVPDFLVTHRGQNAPGERIHRSSARELPSPPEPVIEAGRFGVPVWSQHVAHRISIAPFTAFSLVLTGLMKHHDS
ncbi:hypothetical protein B0T14DRAFT_309561 [Immersiella caudata]|uniref:Uncharacterized protein n=1 Tax=Immersiella caudata TaxID=314043 RepID=A0AA39WFJ0_9PEZI|nr:hypothetical protein B0T14DRAFT_309561 [Immersiella caudata]